MPSLPPVSAKVVADAEQFINEFKRADNAARRSSAAISGEVDKLAKGLKKKFELADFGKDVLKGAGLFGGFSVAQTAADLIVGHFREAAEQAQRIEASSERQLKHVREMISLRQNDYEKQTTLQQQLAQDQAALAAASAQRYSKSFKGGVGFDAFSLVDDKSRPRERTKEEQAAVDKLQESVNAAELAIRKMQDAAGEKAVGEFFRSLDEASAKLPAAKLDAQAEATARAKKEYESWQGVIKHVNEELDKQDATMARLADQYREVADPSLKFKTQLEEIDRLMKAGRLSSEEAAGAIRNVNAAMADDESRRVDGALKGFFDDLDEQSKRTFDNLQKGSRETERILGLAADGMANAWVDALSGVEGAWGNLGRSIIRELELIAVKMLLIKPAFNLLGSLLPGVGFLAPLAGALTSYGTTGKAMGGGTEGGVTYRVNEQGEEFFKSNQGGTIIPAGIARGMTTKSRGGDTFYIDATGADASKLGQLESMIRSINGSVERRSVAAIIAARRKGGGMGGALA